MKLVDPGAVVREGKLGLELLGADHTTVEAQGIVEDALNHPGIERCHGQLDFLADDVVRQIGQEAHVRDSIEKVMGEEQLVGHPAAVRLDQERYAGRARQLPLAFEQDDAFLNVVGSLVGLHGQVMHRISAREVQGGL